MPTYDYECDGCGHSFELFQPITESPKKKCPECAKPKLRRLFGTGAALMFKGSGFYQTDYRSESYRKAAAADKPAGDNSSGKSESKPESKPDGKSEGKPEGKSENQATSKAEDKPASKSSAKRKGKS